MIALIVASHQWRFCGNALNEMRSDLVRHNFAQKSLHMVNPALGVSSFVLPSSVARLAATSAIRSIRFVRVIRFSFGCGHSKTNNTTRYGGP
jgi:hypothetical protein